MTFTFIEEENIYGIPEFNSGTLFGLDYVQRGRKIGRVKEERDIKVQTKAKKSVEENKEE